MSGQGGLDKSTGQAHAGDMPVTDFVMQDNTTGRFQPEHLTWEQAQAAADADPFLTIRRADEVEMGWT